MHALKRDLHNYCLSVSFFTMAAASVTDQALTEADMINSLLKKSFSVGAMVEQNIIFDKQTPIPNLHIRTKGRQFQMAWYKKKDWLSGSTQLKRLFCWPCLLFCPGMSPTWSKNGHSNMHGILCDCKKHEKVKSHMSAFKTWKTYECCA